MNTLEAQLKETKAIGFFTKIALKNQVDDLLDQFREYYQGKAKLTMTDLRRSYDLLMMKVLSLLQDEDQKLASAIVSSREAIWGLLADPKNSQPFKSEHGRIHEQTRSALAQSLVVAAFFAGPSFADDDEALKKDLTAVIALHGLPCGQVVAVKSAGRERLRCVVQGREHVSRLSECCGAGGCRKAQVGAIHRGPARNASPAAYVSKNS